MDINSYTWLYQFKNITSKNKKEESIFWEYIKELHLALTLPWLCLQSTQG